MDDNSDQRQTSSSGDIDQQDSHNAVDEVEVHSRILTPMTPKNFQNWQLAITFKQRVDMIRQIMQASYSKYDGDDVPGDTRQTLVDRASEVERNIFDKSNNSKQYFDDVDRFCERVICRREEQEDRAEKAKQKQEVGSENPGAQCTPQSVPQTCRWKEEIKPLPSRTHRHWYNNVPTELRVDNIYDLITASFPRWETCPIPEERRQSLTQTALEMERRGFEESTTILQYFDYMAMYVIRISMKV